MDDIKDKYQSTALLIAKKYIQNNLDHESSGKEVFDCNRICLLDLKRVNLDKSNLKEYVQKYDQQERNTMKLQKEVIINLKKYFDSDVWKKDQEKYKSRGYSKKMMIEHVLHKVVQFSK